MIQLHHGGVTLHGGVPTPAEAAVPAAREKTMAYQILRRHDTPAGDGLLHLTFDSLISHDITYVGVIQTAKASGMTEFPVPYVLTNCHNSLCAVGGTINEDDHVFGLSAAIKYGGDYVPANQAVIHQYAREMMSGCGRMILGSDSHTRYGALGTMGVGEGGPEIVKQLLRNTYDLAAPQVILVHVTGRPRHGVGPHDVAIALCGAVYKNGFVKNKVLEFAGPAVSRLPMDYRIGIDVMTTETACLSSIWETDGAVADYLTLHGREEAFTALHPQDGAYYDGMITIDLDRMEPMAALPFHPSEAVTLRELIHCHAEPYGISCGAAVDLRSTVPYTAGVGISQWKVISEFCRTYGGFLPRFAKTGELLATPEQDSGKRIILDSGSPVLNCRIREDHYGVLTEALVIDKRQNVSYSVKNPEMIAKGGQCRRVIYTPGRSTWDAMRYTGEYQIQQSKKEEQAVTVTLPGSFDAFPGDRVTVRLEKLGLTGNYRVAETENRFSAREGAVMIWTLKECD